jgi:hypothetical protein
MKWLQSESLVKGVQKFLKWSYQNTTATI